MVITCAGRLFRGEADGVQKGAEPLKGLAGRYMALRKRLSEMLGRGDRDYSALTALSQEIGRIRPMIRQELERRRQQRKERRDGQDAARIRQPVDRDARRTIAA